MRSKDRRKFAELAVLAEFLAWLLAPPLSIGYANLVSSHDPKAKALGGFFLAIHVMVVLLLAAYLLVETRGERGGALLRIRQSLCSILPRRRH